MKFGETIHVIGTIVGIALGITALVVQFKNSREDISIEPAQGINGEFHLTPNGVSQEIEFTVINKGSSSTVIQRVDISPGFAFPPRVMIDGVFWDGRPFRFEPKQVSVFRFLATRDFNSINTEEAKAVRLGQPINAGYLDLFRTFDHLVASENRLDKELHKAAGHPLSRLYEPQFAEQLQIALFKAGRTFDGDNLEAAERLSDLSLDVTFGGPCLSYMVHTLSVCSGLEVTTVKGNLFASEYIGFGLRSSELDQKFTLQN